MAVSLKKVCNSLRIILWKSDTFMNSYSMTAMECWMTLKFAKTYKSIKTIALDFSEKRFPCLRWSQENRGGCNRCGGRFSGNKKTFLSLLLWQYGDDIKDTLDIVLFWEKRNQVKYLVFQVKGKQSRCWLFSQNIYLW